MSVPYKESYLINGTVFGIEDHKDGKPDHFFPAEAKASGLRYHVWNGGWGIGRKATIEECRRHIYDRAKAELETARSRLIRNLAAVESALNSLESESDLGNFKNK